MRIEERFATGELFRSAPDLANGCVLFTGVISDVLAHLISYLFQRHQPASGWNHPLLKEREGEVIWERDGPSGALVELWAER